MIAEIENSLIDPKTNMIEDIQLHGSLWNYNL